LIIRHAEKPANGDGLSPEGFQRAKDLVPFFFRNPAVTRFGAPAAIYAMAPKGQGGSIRAIQTVTPLAAALHMAIDTRYTRDQIRNVVQEVMSYPGFDGRMVLICWEHTVIPQLAAEFGASEAPQVWDDNDFSSVWELDFVGNAMKAFFSYSEGVLPGDPPAPTRAL